MSNFALVIAGTEKDLYTDYGFVVTAATGIGMPPMDNIHSNYAIGDGAFYQRSIARPRVINLTGFFQPSSLANLHSKRKTLINDINRDARAGAAFTLRYHGANVISTAYADIDVRYNGGLDGDMDAASALHQPFSLSLLAVDPFWRGGAPIVSTGTWGVIYQPGGGNYVGVLSLTNPGSVQAYPSKINLKYTGADAIRLLGIRNTLTDDSLLFYYYIAAATPNPELTIVCTPGARSITDQAGNNKISELLPGSNFLSFGISPGTHNYEFTVAPLFNYPNVYVNVDYDIEFNSTYFSADGVA